MAVDVVRQGVDGMPQLARSQIGVRAEQVLDRARYLIWCVRRPRLRPGPPFRIGARGALVFTGLGALHRGENLVISQEFSLYAQAAVRFGSDVYINRNVVISAFSGVEIGDRTLIAERVSIHDENHIVEHEDKTDSMSGSFSASAVRIGSDVWIGANSVILSGVTIGDGTVVGAGSVVSRSLPGGSLAAGAPAKVIRTLRP